MTASTTHHTQDTGSKPRPPRLAFGSETWKEITYLLLNLPFDIAGFVYVVTVLWLGAGLAVTVIGLPLLSLGLLGCRLAGHIERARARALLDVDIADPSPVRPRQAGFFPWLWAALSDKVAWRHALYLFIRLPWGIATFTVVLPSLFVAWPVLPWIARGLTTVDRAMVRGLLSPDDELERRIAELESSRGTVVDTAAADLRRIERDLHDGAQARL
ncbi:sensor domain-containing protein, partial [Wenjunlia tyrosinilytica]|uniref:sensor domain-containing protein n=1 Tax=Wenjunlia tyrosinilytica TaxID=1544741 RepID=UPI00166E30EE